MGLKGRMASDDCATGPGCELRNTLIPFRRSPLHCSDAVISRYPVFQPHPKSNCRYVNRKTGQSKTRRAISSKFHEELFTS